MHYGEVVLRSVRFAKRAIDVAGAAVGLILTAPLMPLIAAAIYIDSPGPVLFRQRRAGSLKSIKSKNGLKELTFHEFDMHKFRTMIPDAEKIVCVGLNYRAHREETGRGDTVHPTLFLRIAESQVGHGQPLLKPKESQSSKKTSSCLKT